MPGYRLKVDLPEQKVRTPNNSAFNFGMDPFRKHCLLEGLDDIGLTLKEADKIKAYEERRRQEAPWLFP
jgi:3-isopropylmalate/(R)-2-methylmalate dehydratase small subunit